MGDEKSLAIVTVSRSDLTSVIADCARTVSLSKTNCLPSASLHSADYTGQLEEPSKILGLILRLTSIPSREE